MAQQYKILVGDTDAPEIRVPATGDDSYLAPVTLDAATGNEVAFDIQYTVNKATSGDDTGLLVNQTDTASPGTSLLADLQVGGTSKFSVDNTGKLTTDTVYIDTTTGGNTVFVDNNATSGLNRGAVLAATGSGATTNVGAYPNAAGATNNYAIQIPDGFPSAGANNYAIKSESTAQSLFSGTVNINKTTLDEPFFDFQATADADATSAISTLTTSGATTHHIQVEINGVTAWIAASTTDPT